MKPIAILWYAIALFAPILYFTVLTDNTNETQPVLVFVVCAVLFAAAGLLSVQNRGDKVKWVGWSVFVGLVEAGMLVWLA